MNHGYTTILCSYYRLLILIMASKAYRIIQNPISDYTKVFSNSEVQLRYAKNGKLVLLQNVLQPN